MPFTVKMKEAEPAGMLAGMSSVTVGTSGEGGALRSLTVKTARFDSPPPGGGFTTVTVTVPGAATSAAGRKTDNWVPLV